MVLKNKKLRLVFGFSITLILAGCQVATVTQPTPAPAVTSSSSTPATSRKPATAAVAPRPGPDQQIPDHTDLWNRIGAGLSLTENYSHPAVDEELQLYIDNQRYIDQIAERATPFLFWIVEEIDSRNLPLEIALLPIIESAYNPSAYSSEHAAGLWQFIGSTAKSFGLQQNWWYDGRRDPLASTEAALDYLEMLYAEFDQDWLLALAAYNAGEGSVRRAIRRNARADKSTDFWNLSLPSETRSHVPRLLAIAKLVSKPQEHSITLPEIPNEAYLEVVQLDFQVDLTRAAVAAGMEPELLQALNPGYLQWATHPDPPQFLAVPRSNADIFRSTVEAIPIDQRVAWDRYQIRSGDTLGAIAAAFKTRVDVLKEVNNLRGSRIIAGDSLLIPHSGYLQSGGFSATAFNNSASASATIPNSYRVRRGDNLWRIARKFKLRSADIASWNGISLESLLHPGQILALNPPGFVASINIDESGMANKINYHIVKGDTLQKIAREFGLSVGDIASWNNLNPRALIYPGQELELFVPETNVN